MQFGEYINHIITTAEKTVAIMKYARKILSRKSKLALIDDLMDLREEGLLAFALLGIGLTKYQFIDKKADRALQETRKQCNYLLELMRRLPQEYQYCKRDKIIAFLRNDYIYAETNVAKVVLSGAAEENYCLLLQEAIEQIMDIINELKNRI